MVTATDMPFESGRPSPVKTAAAQRSSAGRWGTPSGARPPGAAKRIPKRTALHGGAPHPIAIPGWLTPAACVALALVVRLWALGRQPWITVDGTEYVRFAESILRGQPFPSIFPPGYPALIALARLAIPDRVTS